MQVEVFMDNMCTDSWNGWSFV